jgi:hypothetical protein
MARRHHKSDAALTDALFRMIGGVFFSSCDGAGPEYAARAVQGLRRFAEQNSDNQDCYTLCHALADAQEDTLHAEDYDVSK